MLDGVPPSAELCQAMQKKVDAETQYDQPGILSSPLLDCGGDGSCTNSTGKPSGFDQHGVRLDGPRGGAGGGRHGMGRTLSPSSLWSSTPSTRPSSLKRSSATSPSTMSSTSSPSMSTSLASSTPLTGSMAAKVLLMAATMLTTMASAASDLLLGGNDGILRAHLIRG